MPPRHPLPRLLAAAAAAVFALVAFAQPPTVVMETGARAYFFTEPGFQGEVFVVDAGNDLNELAPILDSRGQPFNNRIRSVQLEGPVRVQLYEHGNFRGSSLWLNGDAPDLGAFSIGSTARSVWDRNISSVKVEALGRGVVVFVRWDRRDAEKVIRACYRDILGRDADGPGLRHYLPRLVDAGWSEEQFRDDLRRSDEFRNRDLDAIIRRSFHDILGREPDASGIASYKRSLSRGMTEGQMREDLRRSREGADKQVSLAITRAYRDVLHREPDPEGLKSYTDLMQHKGWTENDVREGLRRSDEFRKQRKG